MRARDLMHRAEVTVRRDTPVKEAARLLAAHAMTALPVVDNGGRLVGLVTDADLLRGRICVDPRSLVHPDWPVAPCPAPPSTVGGVMRGDVVARTPSADLAELVGLMVDRGLRVVPLVRDTGELVGVVTRGDLLRMVARHDQDVERDVRHRIASCAHRRHWDVSVADGVVTLAAEDADETERHVVAVVAGSIPGVVSVRMSGGR